jgi:hypothetical protein
MADFTIADVLAWARTKPADSPYDYGSTNNCALCQFLRETERADTPVAGGLTWGGSWNDYGSNPKPIPEKLRPALVGATFGALVARLEALVPEPPRSDWSRLSSYMVDIDGEMAPVSGRCASRRSGVLRTEPKVSALRAPAAIAGGSL